MAKTETYLEIQSGTLFRLCGLLVRSEYSSKFSKMVRVMDLRGWYSTVNKSQLAPFDGVTAEDLVHPFFDLIESVKVLESTGD